MDDRLSIGLNFNESIILHEYGDVFLSFLFRRIFLDNSQRGNEA